jgi:preprotein translocase subunit SecA
MTGTVTTLFKIPVAQIAHQQVMIKAQEQKNLITNEDQIEAALNQDISEDAQKKVVRIGNKSNSNSGLPKVGRNDACPCGSGKKYKKCHGA